MVSNPFIKWSLCFFSYCFLGWLWETFYVFILTGQLVNRGFLHGPFLPIYGFGALIILWLTTPVKENTWMIFLLGMLGATMLEYVSGTLIEQLFHVRYWDYSGFPLNLNGLICIPCSIVWGFFSIFLVRKMHGRINSWVLSIPQSAGLMISTALILFFSADVLRSTKELMHL